MKGTSSQKSLGGVSERSREVVRVGISIKLWWLDWSNLAVRASDNALRDHLGTSFERRSAGMDHLGNLSSSGLHSGRLRVHCGCATRSQDNRASRKTFPKLTSYWFHSQTIRLNNTNTHWRNLSCNLFVDHFMNRSSPVLQYFPRPLTLLLGFQFLQLPLAERVGSIFVRVQSDWGHLALVANWDGFLLEFM